MITAQELFIFYSKKDNYNLFKEYNPKFQLTFKQMFKEYSIKYINKYTKDDFLKWIYNIENYINLSVFVDFYNKFKD